MFGKYALVLLACFVTSPVLGATVVASVNGTPITDTDITARTKLMSRQGNTATDNRRIALQNIIDDNVKLAYAANFKAVPEDKVVDSEIEKMNLGDMSASERAMARSAMRADIAWQIVVARTIMPTVEVSREEINTERASLAAERGLPIEMTLIRLVNIPAETATKLASPKSCDDAMAMATLLGGAPQKFTALQYELSPEIRNAVANLKTLKWSERVDGNIFLVCDTKKTAEYGKLDDIIKQNAMYKQAMFMADQQLKQLRRRAVIVINDDRYKL